jgi:hypothetical protein
MKPSDGNFTRNISFKVIFPPPRAAFPPLEERCLPPRAAFLPLEGAADDARLIIWH